MNETVLIIFAFVAGAALGILFFGGLWYTVKKIVDTKMPVVWVLGSFIFRVAVVLVGFYFISSGNWQRLVVCVIGFIAARFIVIHFTKSIDEKQMHIRKEAAHEA